MLSEKPPIKQELTSLNIKLPNDLIEKVLEASAKKDISLDSYIERSITETINRDEAIEFALSFLPSGKPSKIFKGTPFR